MLDEFDCKNEDESEEEHDYKNSKNIHIIDLTNETDEERKNRKEKEEQNRVKQTKDSENLIITLNEKLKKFENFKLKMIAIPLQTGGNSLQKRLSKKDWNIIRNKTIEFHNHKCGMCNKQIIEFNCHEMWEFDDTNSIQILKKCIPLCDLCHAGVHPNHVHGTKRMSLYETTSNFCNVNNCTYEIYNEYRKIIIELENARGVTKFYTNSIWKMNYGEYEQLVKNKLGDINEETLNKKKNSVFGGKFVSFKINDDVNGKVTTYGIDKDGNETLLNNDYTEIKKNLQPSLLDYL